MPGYSITPESLETSSNSVKTKATQIEQLIGELRTTVNEVSGYWTGRAHERFQEVYGEWDQAIRQMKESLDRIGLNMGVAAKNFADAEAASSFK